jgi:hypothetical protein
MIKEIEKFDDIDDYRDCDGCDIEIWECYKYQNTKGYSSGLEFFDNHVFFFVIHDKTDERII